MVPEGYKLVFEDNFDSGSLDLDNWSYRANGPRRCGFNAPSAVSIENGHLVIRQTYRDGEYGLGWYGGMIRATKRFCRGYFEIRCICSDATQGSFWSAFWLQGPSPYDPEISRGGIGPGGAEIDILEAFCDENGQALMESNIHCAGKRDSKAAPGGLDSFQPVHRVVSDGYSAFHTYALEWTETEYRFFLDGELQAVTSWGDGVSSQEEELIVSLELPGKAPESTDMTSTFIVDSVRIWQKD